MASHDVRKRELRAAVSAQRRGPGWQATRDAIGHAVAEVLLATPEFSQARSVALYAAIADELPTQRIHFAARGADKRCFLPRVLGEGLLEFAEAARFEDLRPGRYGVSEPSAGSIVVDLAEIDLVIVPGLAFDRQGRRLGRGGGYYDRAIERARDEGAGPFFIGLVPSDELLDEVPAGELDQSVDAVATENGLIRAGIRG